MTGARVEEDVRQQSYIVWSDQKDAVPGESGVACACTRGATHYLYKLQLTDEQLARFRDPSNASGRGGHHAIALPGATATLRMSRSRTCKWPNTNEGPWLSQLAANDQRIQASREVRRRGSPLSAKRMTGRRARGGGPPSRIDTDHLRSLPLPQFRELVLTCNACFAGAGGCRHHEDVLGGYGEGKIVVVGINPQAPQPGSTRRGAVARANAVYSAIEQASPATKLALSDRLLDVFRSADVRVNNICADWTWEKEEHPGLSDWLPRAANLFGVSNDELAEHFAFVETFKHATSDDAELRKLAEWPVIENNCPVILREQLRRLRPRLVVVCGNFGLRTVAPLLLSHERIREHRGVTISKLHGSVDRGEVGGEPVPVLFCYAISRNTQGAWRRDLEGPDVEPRPDIDEGAGVRAVIRAAINSAATDGREQGAATGYSSQEPT